MGSKERSGVLAAGNWIVDRVKLIEEFPEQDALVSITSESDSNGGGPYNLLKDLALLGAEFPLAGAGQVGEDANGAAILAECDALGIDRSRVRISRDAPTSYTDVMTVTATGRRTFFHQRGANARFDGADLALDQSNAKIFYLGYLLLLDTLDVVNADGSTLAAKLLQLASATGHRTAVDLVSAQSGRFREIVAPSLPHTDILFLNEYEAGSLLGDELGECDRRALETAATKIRALGVRELVVIHRPDGAAVSSPDGHYWQGSVDLPPEQILGAVGAGDAFAAGMLFGLHDGESIDTCLKRAVCSAALCLLDPTTSGGMAPLSEALKLGGRYGFRE